MLQLGSRSRRAIVPCYICTSCTATVLQFQAAPISRRCYATTSKPRPRSKPRSAPPTPRSDEESRKSRPKSTTSDSGRGQFALWRETLDVIKSLQNGEVQREEASLSQGPEIAKESQEGGNRVADDLLTKGARGKPLLRGTRFDLLLHFSNLSSKPLNTQIDHLHLAITKSRPLDGPTLEKILRGLWEAVESQGGDDAPNLKLRLEKEQARLLRRHGASEDPLSLLKEQLDSVQAAIHNGDRGLIQEKIQRFKDSLDSISAQESEANRGQAQPSLSEPAKGKPRRNLLDGALSVLTDILASQVKKQSKSKETNTPSSKDGQQTPKKKTKKTTSASIGSAALGKEASPNASQSPNDAPNNDSAEPVSRDSPTRSPVVRRVLTQSKRDPTNHRLRDVVPKAKGRKVDQKMEFVNAKKLSLVPIDVAQPEVPKLQYGLDRALFNPGVYHLQDPRSRVYNFDPYLASIMPIDQFDFNALKEYVTSSKDETLISMAAQHKKKYTGSTSSMTAMLSHFHYLLSSWRPINPAHTSRSFSPESFNFTRIMRAPAAAFLHWKDGTYAIDADKQFDSANILSMLGKSMEKLLTLPKDEYEKYRVINSDQLTEEQRNADESYHYTTMGDFMMRSQLDAYDGRLPGSGMFDLKTRAVVSIRMDAKDFHKGVGYEIRHRIGQWESYEREYFDMIRSAFLKYSLQVRMGRMDGIFVAFHNTRRIFGFQYVSIDEMDLALHGTSSRVLGDREFKISLSLLNKVLDRATAKFPGRSLRLHVETRVGVVPFMYIFAKPVDTNDIQKVQNANKESIEAFEREILGLKSEDGKTDRIIEEQEELDDEEDDPAEDRDGLDDTKLSELAEQENDEVWQHMREAVEQTIENEALGLETLRETIQDALTESGLLPTTSPDESSYYVNSLLEALKPEYAAKQNGLDIDLADDDGDIVQSSATQEGADDESSMAKISADQLTSDVEESTEDNAATILDSASADQSTSGIDNHSRHMSVDREGLKRLIASLAVRAEAKPLQDDQDLTVDNAESDDFSSDQFKLRKFGNILAEMINKNKGSSSSAEEISPLDPSGEDEASEAEESTDAAEQTETAATTASSKEEILGLILTVRNRVNGQYVERPENLSNIDNWIVPYHLEELSTKRAGVIYRALKKRRQAALAPDRDRKDEWEKMYQGNLKHHSQKGHRFRRRETAAAKTKPVHIYGQEKPLKYEEVFGEVNQ